MKIMNKLAALIAAMAMCMTTVSTSVSAKSMYLSDEGNYNETQTEEIVTEEEIPVEEEIPADEEVVPAEEEVMPEETVPADEMPEEAVPQEEIPANEQNRETPDTIVNGIPVYFDYEGEGIITVTGETDPVSKYVTLTVHATPADQYSLDIGSLSFESGANDVHKYKKDDFSTMFITRYDVGSIMPITVHANFKFCGTYYPITISQNENHGTVKVFVNSVEADKAYAGQVISVNAQTIENGYLVTEFHVLKSDGSEVPSRAEERYGRNFFEFNMPNESVTVNLTYTKMPLYNINLTVGNNIPDYHTYVGGGDNDVRQAIAGAHVFLAFTPDFEHRNHPVSEVVNAETGEPVEMENGNYVMPAADINISIYARHNIKLVQDGRIQSVKFIVNGSEDSVALHDEEVTVIAEAIKNYRVESITATDSAGNELEVNQESGTFTMPDRDVTVRVKPAISYVDENGEQHYQEEFTYISDVQEGIGYGLSNGWYVLDKDVTFNEHRMTIVGDVNLILCDGATLNINQGIRCGDKYNNGNNSLTIWAQKEGTGKIKAGCRWKSSAIGGDDDENCGTINIHGGVIEAHGCIDGAGIGGGDDGDGGTIRIYGGTIKAYGSGGASGIGGGDHGDGGNITIYGGTIDAIGGGTLETSYGGAGIGGGDESNGGTITIRGGTIKATSGAGGAAIGGGDEGNGGIIEIYDGTIIATGGVNTNDDFLCRSAAGIGGGDDGDSGEITIYGGNIIATATFVDATCDDVWGAGIGAGDDGSVNNIQILGGERIECHGYRAVGRGEDGKDGNIVLGDNIEIEGFNWNDRYSVLSYGHDLILRAR